jgi:hypothetical protein
MDLMNGIKARHGKNVTVLSVVSALWKVLPIGDASSQIVFKGGVYNEER